MNRNLQYITREGQEEPSGTLTNFLEKHKKKVTLLQYFRNYMSEHLLKAGGPRGTAVEANEVSRLPYLRTWYRTRRAIVLHLSNGILQVSHPLPTDNFMKYKMLAGHKISYFDNNALLIITTTIITMHTSLSTVCHHHHHQPNHQHHQTPTIIV
jgi:hypothetical protein